MEVDPRQLQLQTLVDSTSACLAASDESGRLTLFSPALEALFEQRYAPVAEEDLPERFGLYDASGERVLHPDEVPLARARAGELVRDAAITARVPGRELLHLVCNGAPLVGDDGVIRGAIVVVDDVSAEHVAALDRVELRKELADTVNHELRTPLTALLAHVELLQSMGDEVSPAVRRPLDTIHAAAWRLNDLLRTISDLVELEENTKVDPSPCDLGELVRLAVVDRARYAEDRDVRIDLHVEEAPAVWADADRVRKAVLALVQGAVTCAPRDSTVVVRVVSEQASVRIEVTDLGRSIPDVRPGSTRALQRHERRNRSDNGRGLGLAVANVVAVSHGGWLDLAPNHPRGLRATLVLPHGSDGAPPVTFAAPAVPTEIEPPT